MGDENIVYENGVAVGVELCGFVVSLLANPKESNPDPKETNGQK